MALSLDRPANIERLWNAAAALVGPELGEQYRMAAPIEVEYWAFDRDSGLYLAPTPEDGMTFWQCLVGDEDEPRAVVELYERYASYAAVSVSHGTLAHDLNAAIHAATEIVGDEDYVVRAMYVPPLDFSGLHLIGADDIVLPFGPGPETLRRAEVAEILGPLFDRLEGLPPPELA